MGFDSQLLLAIASTRTLEYEYYLMLAPNPALVQSMITRKSLTTLTAYRRDSLPCGANDLPAWFLPKLPAEYEVWSSSSNFMLFRDRQDGTVFMCDELV